MLLSTLDLIMAINIMPNVLWQVVAYGRSC